MPESHSLPSKPSPLLALVALSIVHRFRPKWCAVSLSDAVSAENVRLERLSRITTATLGVFEAILARKTAIGRPSKKNGEDHAGQLFITETLLETTTAVLKTLSPECKRKARDIIVGAWLRIRSIHPEIKQETFAAALSIPTRTLRSWIQKPQARKQETKTSPDSEKPRKRPPRRPRFRFELRLPEHQFAADTTDVSAFGVQLKLIATQDVGGRDQDLLDTIIIDDHESSDTIVEVFKKTLSGLPGAQLLSDQGTPYMAKKTREAIASLEIEHAPQKEGDPTGKSTIERAFESVRNFARPILDLTDQLQTALPALRDTSLAMATATLVITALLRAYQAGSRASKRALHETGALTEKSLQNAATVARENARAIDRSARLFLEHIHKVYDMPRSEKSFVDSLRRYPIEVLKEAERRFRSEIPRRDIRDHASYFAAIVRSCHETHKLQRARERRSIEKKHQLDTAIQSAKIAQDDLHTNPTTGLRKSLDLIALQWMPSAQTLLGQGAGLGAVFLRNSIARLVELHGHQPAADIASSVMRDFSQAQALRLGENGICAIRRLLEAALPSVPTNQNNSLFQTSNPIATLASARKTTHLPRSDPLPT